MLERKYIHQTKEKISPLSTPPPPPKKKNIKSVKELARDVTEKYLQGRLLCVDFWHVAFVCKQIFRIVRNLWKSSIGRLRLQ